MLRIAPNAVLPSDLAGQTVALLGQDRRAVRDTAAVIVEELIGAGGRVAVVDSLGEYRKLLYSRDGRREELPIALYGGARGEVPLDAGSGAEIADRVAGDARSVVLDLSHTGMLHQGPFLTAFCERLAQCSTAPLHLVLANADWLAHESGSRDAALTVDAVEDLVRLGPARGIGVTLVSAAPAGLNQRVLAETRVLLALRTVAPQHRAAIAHWSRAHRGVAEREEWLLSLASLPGRTAWLCSPEWLGICERVHVREPRTCDPRTAVDAALLNDPPMTHAQAMAQLDEIAASLDEHMNGAAVASDSSRESAAHPEGSTEQRELDDADVLVRMFEVATQAVDMLEQGRVRTDESLRRIRALGREIDAACRARRVIAGGAATGTAGAGGRTPPGRRVAAIRVVDPPAVACEDKILALLAQATEGQSRERIAIRIGCRCTSAGFKRALRTLRSKGYLEGSSAIRITATGRAAPTAAVDLLTARELRAYWLARLGRCEERVLRPLVDSYPAALTAAQLVALMGEDEWFVKLFIDALRRERFVEGGDLLRASPDLFSD